MYDIFISYRRTDSNGLISGTHVARLFKYFFLHKQYRVFFDYSDIGRTNDFEKTILTAVRKSKIFLLVITKDTFLRCSSEDDWVRREIEEAIKNMIPIVPVNIDASFKGWPLDMPSSLSPISKIQQFTIHTDHTFEICMDYLLENIKEISEPNTTKEKEKEKDTAIKTSIERQEIINDNTSDKNLPTENQFENATSKNKQEENLESGDKEDIEINEDSTYEPIKDNGDNKESIPPILKNQGNTPTMKVEDKLPITEATDSSCGTTSTPTICTIEDLADLSEEILRDLTSTSEKDSATTPHPEEESNATNMPAEDATVKDGDKDLETLLNCLLEDTILAVNSSEKIEGTDNFNQSPASEPHTTITESDKVTVLQSESITGDNQNATYKIKTNKKCILYIDDKEVQTIEPNVLTRILLPKGKYFRKFVDYNNHSNINEVLLDLTQDNAESIVLN